MSERKDIDAIVGATVKLEESFNKRISELENKFKNHTHGSNGKDIAELRKRIGHTYTKINELEEWVERNQNYSNGNNNQLWLLKAVLRELVEIVRDTRMPRKDVFVDFNRLLAKLDSRTDWIKDMADGPQQEIEWRRREKVSGGKKL